MNTSELRDKDVINLCDGMRLGHIAELDFDPVSGRVCAMSVVKDIGLLCFGKSNVLRVPWDCIECIGEDAVLIKVPPREITDQKKK